MEYPDEDMLSLFNKVGAKHIYAYSNQSHQPQDLFIGASGRVNIESDTFESTGDIMLNSNLVVNDSAYFGDISVFRTFSEGHTISYSMRVSDEEKLQFFKHDTRKNKSVLVNQIGIGAITDANDALVENTTGKLNGLYNKAQSVIRKVG